MLAFRTSSQPLPLTGVARYGKIEKVGYKERKKGGKRVNVREKRSAWVK
jgi:hypothetical protein